MWPAPITAVSPWALQNAALAFRPSTAPAHRVAPARPETKAAPKPESTRVQAGEVRGVALRFDQWFGPQCESIPGVQVKVRVGALDRCLEKVSAGKHTIRLHFDHNTGLETIDTTNSAFRVWVDDNELHFAVRPITTGGRIICNVCREFSTHRQASVGLTWLGFQHQKGEADLPRYVLNECMLTEISLVPVGACNGVWVRVG